MTIHGFDYTLYEPGLLAPVHPRPGVFVAGTVPVNLVHGDRRLRGSPVHGPKLEGLYGPVRLPAALSRNTPGLLRCPHEAVQRIHSN